MEKRRIKYNADFLPDLIRRVTASHGRKTIIVDAMNTADNERKVTLTQLQRWTEPGAMVPTERIINLVNQMKDVSLANFFIYEDTNEGVEIIPKDKRPRKTGEDDNAELVRQLKLDILEMRLANSQEKELLAMQKESDMKALAEKYEKQLTEQKKDYEKRLDDLQRLMQGTIDLQKDYIVDLKNGMATKKKRPKIVPFR